MDNLTVDDKIKLFNDLDINKVDDLIRQDLNIKPGDIFSIHNPKIPLSFYENFGFSINQVVDLLEDIRLSNPNYDLILKQVFEVILSEDINIGIIQKWFFVHRFLSIKTLKAIQKKYNILQQSYDVTLLKKYYRKDEAPKGPENFGQLLAREISEGFFNMQFGKDNIMEFIKIVDLMSTQDNINLSCFLDHSIELGEINLVRKLLEQGVEPTGNWWFECDRKTILSIFELLTTYIGEDNLYKKLLEFFKMYDTYNTRKAAIIIGYMCKIKSIDQVVDDIESTDIER